MVDCKVKDGSYGRQLDTGPYNITIPHVARVCRRLLEPMLNPNGIQFAALQVKELRNGRLAMLAYGGAW